MDVTTRADDLIVAHDGLAVHRLEDLRPDTEYDVRGVAVRTLPRPPGELLCRFATVNDVHFGEVEAGRIDDHAAGPVQRVADGEAPYPETMNRGAIGEMLAAGLAAVVVKGDLTNDGETEELAAFEAHYRTAFGPRLYVVRGNHDAHRGQSYYTGDQWISLPGIAIALMDTTIPCRTNGTLSPAQLEWLETNARDAPTPVIAMGHHQQWVGESDGVPAIRSDDYFGLDPDASDALSAVIERCPAIIAYTAGHTHRHRVRLLPSGVPTIEVGCVKDFPGTWAEHRVYEGGVTQVVHRVSTPDALAWSERCRHLYSDFGIDYETYALGRLEDRCLNLALR
jgi:3',5'-cyclic AMP phosphodiesterase CpdA